MNFLNTFLYEACEAGTFGNNCASKCDYPAYGINCQYECNCSSSDCDIKAGCRKIGNSFILSLFLCILNKNKISPSCFLFYYQRIFFNFPFLWRASVIIVVHNVVPGYFDTNIMFLCLLKNKTKNIQN